MTIRKHQRNNKQQLGQFMTPRPLAKEVIKNGFHYGNMILEPSFGDGSFIIELAKKLMVIYNNDLDETFKYIYGIELDKLLYNKCLENIEKEFGRMPINHNLHKDDFLLYNFNADFNEFPFNRILGNPPFGGTISLENQNKLEELYGNRYGQKIKRETYSYFIVKCVELLKDNGKLSFICSDTFLTIKTMAGLRNFLMKSGRVVIKPLKEFSDETEYGMVIIDFTKGFIKNDENIGNHVKVFGEILALEDIKKTGNFSWGNINKYKEYFGKDVLGNYIICTGGMTIGKNELFVREIIDRKITEPYDFVFFDKPISLKEEIQKAHLQHLSDDKKLEIKNKEKNKETKLHIDVIPLSSPKNISIPNNDYKYYNKMVKGDLYIEPKYVVFWKDDGLAVKTFKKNGNWYLHGIGGMPYFEKEGITWNLIGTKINPRYLSEGYILDSGCPCAFLKENINKSELYFIMGWLLTDKSNEILKDVINHTRNIQGKDIERLPYPFWINDSSKKTIIEYVKLLIKEKKNNNPISENYIEKLTYLFKK